MRILLMAAILALCACAALRRPDGAVTYACENTNVRFTVTYAWDPPSAHIEEQGYPTLDLPASAPASGVGRHSHNFGGGSADRPYLNVNDNGRAYFYRPGRQPVSSLNCFDVSKEVVVVT